MDSTTQRQGNLRLTGYRAAPSKPSDARPWYARGWGRPGALLLSVILLTFAFAPIGQFYLAWVGLVPWLCLVYSTRSMRAAFLWSWLGGILFFSVNMWWLGSVSFIGTVALVIYLGLYWALAGWIIRGTQSLGLGIWWPAMRSTCGVLFISAIWVTCEYLRGNVMTGLPWLYLGHTQSPFLLMCQVADIGGAYAVTFWVVAINALIAFYVLHPDRRFSLIPITAFTVMLLVVVFRYGERRRDETARTTSPGPVMAVIQPNYPQSNTGDKSGSNDDHLSFHEAQTTQTVQKAEKELGHVDVVVWSETMMPPINTAYRQVERQVLGEENIGESQSTLQHLSRLCASLSTNLLTGSLYYDQYTRTADGKDHFADRRNCAYWIDASGRLSDLHYDKVHLVPFGEFLPFKESVPWLNRLFQKLGPYDFDYTLTRGDDSSPTVFPIPCEGIDQPVRFAVPICFEDIDADLDRRTISGPTKRANVLVNMTNDGWFAANENAQHLQVAVFRSIENRVPIARSVNTGISGFIDSYGRVKQVLPARVAGSAAMRLRLDSRHTWYGEQGDWFAQGCILATIGLILEVRLRKRK